MYLNKMLFLVITVFFCQKSLSSAKMSDLVLGIIHVNIYIHVCICLSLLI